MSDFEIPRPVAPGSTIVIGFLGGFENWNDNHRSVRKLAVDLRRQGLPNVYAETIENRHAKLALKLIDRAITVKRRHAKPARVAGVRVILYGQSLGGSAVVSIARELKGRGIPVRLTVQVDSVGLRDSVIPSNVRAAANLYQHDPLTIVGREEIRAEDPAATTILENTRLSYIAKPFDSLNKQDASWVRRTLGGGHAKLEADEAVWRHVEDLIGQAIASAP